MHLFRTFQNLEYRYGCDKYNYCKYKLLQILYIKAFGDETFKRILPSQTLLASNEDFWVVLLCRIWNLCCTQWHDRLIWYNPYYSAWKSVWVTRVPELHPVLLQYFPSNMDFQTVTGHKEITYFHSSIIRWKLYLSSVVGNIDKKRCKEN